MSRSTLHPGSRISRVEMGRLVQQPAAIGTDRQHPAEGSRGTLLRRDQNPRHGSMTHNRMLPTNPGRFSSVASFIAQYRKADPEVLSIARVDPVETAADKLSAFVWRMIIRDRMSKKDDPTIVRHLHDLAALEDAVGRSGYASRRTPRSGVDRDRPTCDDAGQARRGSGLSGRVSSFCRGHGICRRW
jgi:hypothetical protein